MIHRGTKLALALSMATIVAGCHHNKVSNPIANLDSKQPDKVLFDRAMEAMKKGKYDVARITLQTLINTYPDSEFIARAKLSVGDSWYAEGSTAAYQQAEVEYKDFQTFFPNLPEAAEAQMKIGNMHYKQMEKPDRDYTHAMRAEDEYRALIQQYPDHKLIPEAKQRLREVQEVLAERQYRIGRFYFLRESYPAAIARLKTLTDTYPLYSQSDEALMMLGHAYEGEAILIKNSKLLEATKIKMVKEYDADAGKVYSHVIERYPLSDRAGDARARLQDLGLQAPKPTPDAIAAYKAEEQSRAEMGRFGKIMSNFHKAPEDLPRAAKVGEPTLVDPQPTSAPQMIRAATNAAMGLGDTAGNSNVSLEKVTPNATKSDPIPRSDAAPAPAATASGTGSGSSDTGIGELTPNAAPPASAEGSAATASVPSAAATAASTPSDTGASVPPQAPAQVNEIRNTTAGNQANASATSANPASDQGTSSSKKKKKKGLKKLVPF